jgi:hypothetical protein
VHCGDGRGGHAQPGGSGQAGGRVAARFLAFFVALSFIRFDGESTPAHELIELK